MARWQAWKSLCVGALCAGFLSSNAMAADAVLSVSSSPVSGGQVTISVNISNITDLFAYQFGLEYNPSILQPVSAVQGSFLTSAGATTFGSAALTGPTSYFVYSSLFGNGPGVTGSGLLANLTFNVLVPNVGLGSFAFTPADTIFLNSALQQITVVPEPSGALLLAAGLAGIGALRLRKSAAGRA